MLLHMYIQACTSTHHALAQTYRLQGTLTHPQTFLVAKSRKSIKATIFYFSICTIHRAILETNTTPHTSQSWQPSVTALLSWV